MFEVKVPEVGESITEGVLVEWSKKDGDIVAVDDAIFELETDKITMTVTAEASGLLHIDVKAGEVVQIDQIVGRIDSDAKIAEPAAPLVDRPAGSPRMKINLAEAEAAQKEFNQEQLDELAPAVRKLVAEHRLDAQQIPASGRDGRLTKADVLAFIENNARPDKNEKSQGDDGKQSLTALQPPAPVVKSVPAAIASAALATEKQKPEHNKDDGSRQTRSKMSRLRTRVAERLVQAQQTAAILTTFNEVDMSAVMALRSQYKVLFHERHGLRLGFMSFFVKAVVDALKAVPNINAQIDGDEIVHNHYFDIGVAVGSPRGLVVPVLRDCDKSSLADIERNISELAERARDGKLTLDELNGGVFTISNGGVYGSLLSTPILNPPQSGILGMHGIKKRPVVVDDQIVIRPMMYLAVSYDHRLVDGTEAVTFLKRIVECVENPERIMLEV